jgi:hypothetical protein
VQNGLKRRLKQATGIQAMKFAVTIDRDEEEMSAAG